MPWPFGPHSFKLRGRPKGVGIFDSLLDMEGKTARAGERKEIDLRGRHAGAPSVEHNELPWPFGPHSFKLRGRPKGVGIFDSLLDMEGKTARAREREEIDLRGNGKQKLWEI